MQVFEKLLIARMKDAIRRKNLKEESSFVIVSNDKKQDILQSSKNQHITQRNCTSQWDDKTTALFKW